MAGTWGRHPLRDRTLLLLMFRHGLRAGEACLLKWDAIMFDTRTISITRLKQSLSSVHRLQADELQALSELRQHDLDRVPVFINERGEQLTTGLQ